MGHGDLVQGLQLMSTLNVPIYITETGIADAAGDRRPLWLQTYIPEVTLQSSTCSPLESSLQWRYTAKVQAIIHQKGLFFKFLQP